MKQAYELLEEARKIVNDPEYKITIAKLSSESGIHDPTLRSILKPGKTNRTLDNLAKLDEAIDSLCKALGKSRPSKLKKNRKAQKET